MRLVLQRVQRHLRAASGPSCIRLHCGPLMATMHASTHSHGAIPASSVPDEAAATSTASRPTVGAGSTTSLIVGKLKQKPPLAATSGVGNQQDTSVPHDGSDRSTLKGRDPLRDKTTASTAGPGPHWKTKRAPWGALQLRDSWSEDAMSKREKDNMNERMHREYRFHPHEQQRRFLKWGGLAVVPTFCLGMALAYYYHMGQAFWKGDPQFVLNVIRSADCSPRSKFYPYRLEGADEYPEHIARYRREQKAKLDEAARLVADAAAQKNAEMQAAIQRVRVA